MKYFTIDIESLDVPENSGHAIVMPNYAVVEIPERFTSDLNWLYVRMSIPEQIDVGLTYDPERTFWNECKTTFPNAEREMAKSYSIKSDEVILNGKEILYPNVPEELRNFLHGSQTIDNEVKLFGNGCNFDTSITLDNHRVRYNDSKLWHYAAPQNLRTLRLLLSEKEEKEMHYQVQPYVDTFCNNVNSLGKIEPLELHNPLYDAAKEALYATYCIQILKAG